MNSLEITTSGYKAF